MRKLLFFLLPIVCAGITSCQKEITGEILAPTGNTNGGGAPAGSTDGDLLVKTFTQTSGSSDSTVGYYSYNAAKQLTSVRTVFPGGYFWDGFERNAAGLIIKHKRNISAQPTDTTVSILTYTSGTNPRVNYSVTTTFVQGNSLVDSFFYEYNTAGKLIQYTDYQDIASTGYMPAQKGVFTYDSLGNVTKFEVVELLTGTISLITSQQNTYDSKTPSISLTDAETIAYVKQPAPLHNAVTSQSSSIGGLPIGSSTYTYTYNSKNRPAIGKNISIQGGVTSTINTTYYYQ